MLSPRAWRAEMGFSVAQMAQHVDPLGQTAPATWRQYEAGRRSPPLDMIALCEELSGGRVTVRSWLDAVVSREHPPSYPATRLRERLKGRRAHASAA